MFLIVLSASGNLLALQYPSVNRVLSDVHLRQFIFQEILRTVLLVLLRQS
jgi:hypothetical protein